MTAIQKEAFPVAGLMYANVNAFDKAKPDHQKPEKGNDFPHITAVREFIATAESRAAWDLVTSTRGGRDWFDHQHREACYIPFVAAKSAAGRGNPKTSTATQTPKASFFVSNHYAHPISGIARTVSMVALVGLRSRRPVPVVSGISTPINVTAISERGNSSGDSLNTTEAATMATIPTQKPSFVWLIGAVRRDMPTITAKIHHIAAETEQEARRSLARDHVCFFAGRIRTGGAHA
ncbi:hypothetical protein B6I51_10530 [Klebsiella pneumoniae]|uniref:host cell division inhibitor Icd-like protein n=1 Tax=Klebsiella pneumoniae TaxID=573 RepID=UPI000C7A1D51|nr:host cell division inhibitor Icd-like protein [Klebsiella pneumoniae]PLD30707.1 hypothetical protein B6I51_10530 [Klebsiella pneumoniae]